MNNDLPKTFKIDPSVGVGDALHMQWSKGKQASEP